MTEDTDGPRDPDRDSGRPFRGNEDQPSPRPKGNPPDDPPEPDLRPKSISPDPDVRIPATERPPGGMSRPDR